jgi:hypothetical protein
MKKTVDPPLLFDWYSWSEFTEFMHCDVDGHFWDIKCKVCNEITCGQEISNWSDLKHLDLDYCKTVAILSGKIPSRDPGLFG